MTKYKGVERFAIALEDGRVRVGDRLITKDIDGKAVFVVAHMDNGKAYMVRKWLLKEPRPMKGDDGFNLMEWLEYDYKLSLPEELRAIMSSEVMLLSRDEVFGDHCFEWFRNVMHRVTAFSKKDEYTRWWWLRDVVSSTDFAYVTFGGISYSYDASAPWVGVRPDFDKPSNVMG